MKKKGPLAKSVLQRANFSLTAILCLFAIDLSAIGAVETRREPPPARKNVISFNPLEALFESYFFNFEHLIAGRHGAVLEAGYIGSYNMSEWPGKNSASWKAYHGYTVGIQYRLHFAERLDSLFIGFFMKTGSLAGTILSTDGPGIVFTSTQGQPPIAFSSSYQIIGLNIGHRFLWEPGVTITLRLGAGAIFTTYRYSTEDFQPNRTVFAEKFDNFLRFDSEISFGFAF